MKKILGMGIAMLFVSFPTFAGDYLTNTNQNAAFLRMLARGASTDVDAAYSNPAGAAFMPEDGLKIGLTIQSAFQTRNISATSPLWTGTGVTTRKYEGKASAPVIPSIHAVYKKGDWAFSGGFAIVGGGGKASFDQGLPMFDAAATASAVAAGLNQALFDINSFMEGRQYIYGVQLGVSRKINEHLSVFGGARMNYLYGGYSGVLDIKLNDKFVPAITQQIAQQLIAAGIPQDVAMAQAKPLAEEKMTQTQAGLDQKKIELDCDQSGWGIQPIIGIDAKFGGLTLAAKYEFKANLNIENKTHKNSDPEGALKSFANGVNTPNDIPAMLMIAAGYDFTPNLRATVEYHFFDDKNAGMADNKQQYLTKGTNEYEVGVEWDVDKILTLSCGGQITDYGLADKFQSDTSFSCDSYSIGLGGRLNLSKRLSLDIAYMWTTYSDYTKNNARGLDPQAQGIDTDVYSRTNKVFGVTLNYKF